MAVKMLNKAIFGLFILMSSVMSTMPIDNFCQSPGVLSLSSSSITGANQVSFDVVSSYVDANRESAPVILVKGDQDDPYKMRSIDRLGAPTTERACLNSAGYNYIKMINEFLILESGNEYYLCRFQLGSDSNLVQMTKPTPPQIDNTVTQFIPYLALGEVVSVAVSSDTQTKIFRYTWAASGPIAPTLNLDLAIGKKLSPTGFGGTELFLFDSQAKKFIQVNSTNTAWIDVTTSGLTAATLTTRSVTIYQLNQRRAIISLVDTNTRRTGTTWSVIDKTAATLSMSITASSKQIVDYTDHQHNFMRVASTIIWWMTMASQGSFTMYRTSIVPSAINGLRDVASVAFSQNKANIFTYSGKMIVYRHNAQGNISLVFKKQVQGLNLGRITNQQIDISMSCTCEAINSYGCFSQTLACIILKKAEQNCIGSGDTYTTWS